MTSTNPIKEKIKVLYVDDESINVLFFKSLFTNKNEIMTAPSGKLGLKILLMYPGIGTVFSDFDMPGMNGVEFITKAKEINPALTCFLLTNSNINEEIQTALDSQLIQKYIRKPLVKQDLISLMGKAV